MTAHLRGLLLWATILTVTFAVDLGIALAAIGIARNPALRTGTALILVSGAALFAHADRAAKP